MRWVEVSQYQHLSCESVLKCSFTSLQRSLYCAKIWLRVLPSGRFLSSFSAFCQRSLHSAGVRFFRLFREPSSSSLACFSSLPGGQSSSSSSFVILIKRTTIVPPRLIR